MADHSPKLIAGSTGDQALYHLPMNGYAIVPDVLSLAEVSLLAGELESMALVRSRAGARHLLKAQQIKALAHDPRLLRLAADVLGSDPVAFGATLFDKSPDANWLVTWHQDTMLPMRERREVAGWGPWSVKDGTNYVKAPAVALSSVVALRVHLDDSVLDNGPLRVLPGSHLHGVLSPEETEAIAARIQLTVCTVAAGGVIILRPLLVHASLKVNSPLPRRVIHIEYAASAVLCGLELLRNIEGLG